MIDQTPIDRYKRLKDTDIIFEDKAHKDMWNYISYKIKDYKYENIDNLPAFEDLKLEAVKLFNTKEFLPLNNCFACEYAIEKSKVQEELKLKSNKRYKDYDFSCKYCPLVQMNYDFHSNCIDGKYLNLLNTYYDLIFISNNEDEFNELKKKCLDYCTQIRKNKIKPRILRRSKIK